MKWEKWILPWAVLPLCLVSLPYAWIPSHSGKWVLYYVLALVGLGFTLLRSEFPRLQSKEVWAFSALAAAILGHMLWFRPSGYEFGLADRLGFLWMVLWAWRLFSHGLPWEAFRWPLASSLLAVSSYGLYQILELGFTGSMPYTQIASTLGHTNTAAQFVGLAMLLLLSLPMPKKHRWLLAFVAVESFAYLFLSRGRSALLAFALAGAVLLFTRFRPLFRDKKKITAAGAVALASLALLVGIQLAKGKTVDEILRFSLFAEKSSAVEYRADVWKQTVKMIKAHPFGVGVDRFSFEFLPFHKKGHTISYNQIATSPHNEFLRYLSEDGIPLSLLIFGFYLWIFALWRKKGWPHLSVLRAPLLFLLVEMAFQFPFHLTLPNYFLAIFMGCILSTIWDSQKVLPGSVQKVAYTILFLGVLALTIRVVGSRFLEKSKDPEWASVGCKLVPTNWNSCLNHSRNLMRDGRNSEARVELEKLLQLEPRNYASFRHLAIVAQRQGDPLEACFYLWKYVDTFNGVCDLTEAYEKNCPYKWRDYFRRKRPSKYYGKQAGIGQLPTGQMIPVPQGESR